MKFLTSAALAVLLACPAFAAPNCASNDQVKAILTEKFEEEIVSFGVTERGEVVMWWGNETKGTWTVTVTQGEVTCIITSGGGFKRVVLSPNV